MAAPAGPSALEHLAARRDAIANDLAKLEKQVGGLGERLPNCIQCGSSDAGRERPRAAPLSQIYDTETTYFTAEYTNFGTVLKASPPAARPATCPAPAGPAAAACLPPWMSCAAARAGGCCSLLGGPPWPPQCVCRPGCAALQLVAAPRVCAAAARRQLGNGLCGC